MRRVQQFIAVFIFCAVLPLPAAVSAAPSLSSLRFHSGSAHDRVVLDLTESADYELDTSEDGRTVTVVLKGVTVKSNVQEPSFAGSRVQSVKWTAKGSEVYVTLQLAPGCKATAGQLSKPARIFIDAVPSAGTTGTQAGKNDKIGHPTSESKTAAEIAAAKEAAKKVGLPDGTIAWQLAPGLMEYEYKVWQDDGWLTAYYLDDDASRKTRKPAL